MVTAFPSCYPFTQKEEEKFRAAPPRLHFYRLFLRAEKSRLHKINTNIHSFVSCLGSFCSVPLQAEKRRKNVLNVKKDFDKRAELKKFFLSLSSSLESSPTFFIPYPLPIERERES